MVLAKLEPFRRAGARTFMISFDDVTKTLTHPEDLVAYGTGDAGFGRANGDFLSRLYVALRRRTPGARLLTVGADYSGTADTQYLQGLRSKLRPGVQVMWTGDQVPSHAFAPADAHAYGKLIGRRPLVWDNWTDDDTAGNALPPGTARIFLGPYLRRADVAGSVGDLRVGCTRQPAPELVAARGRRARRAAAAAAPHSACVGRDQLVHEARPERGPNVRAAEPQVPAPVHGWAAVARSGAPADR